MEYRSILKAMENVARTAGQSLLTQEINVKGHKTRNDLLTENDLVIENLIIRGIKEQFPEINIISEEYNPDNPISGLTVTVDPIDGTCNYAQGLDFFGVQLALFDGETLSASVIYFPIGDVMYTAEKGKGAFKNGKRLFCDNEKAACDGFLLISDYYDSIDIDFNKQFELVKRLQPHFLKTRHFGAACLDFAMLAENKAVAYITYYSKIWDIAPGLLLTKEAGFAVSAVNSEEYCLNKVGLIVASNEETLNIIKTQARLLEM